MGLRDILTGRSSVKRPAARERLFALSTAYVTLETAYSITSAGVAGIVVQALATSDFQAMLKDTEEVVKATAGDFEATVETQRRRLRLPLGDRPRPGDRGSRRHDQRRVELDRGGRLRRAPAVRGVRLQGRRRRRDQLHLQLQARHAGTRSSRRPGDKQRNTERELQLKAQIGGRAADRARARALVPALGHSVLGELRCLLGWRLGDALGRSAETERLLLRRWREDRPRRVRGDSTPTSWSMEHFPAPLTRARNSDFVFDAIEAGVHGERLRHLGVERARPGTFLGFDRHLDRPLRSAVHTGGRGRLAPATAGVGPRLCDRGWPRGPRATASTRRLDRDRLVRQRRATRARSR